MPRLAYKLTIFCLFLAMPGWAQWQETPPPANSAYWWTLTDSIEPQVLRRLYMSKAFHQELYDEARRQGLWHELSAEERSNLSTFILGSMTPEYHRLPDVLWSFSGYVEVGRVDRLGGSLGDYGISEEGQKRILAAAEESLEVEDHAIEEISYEAGKFLEILTAFYEETSLQTYQDVLRKRQYGRLARHSGLTVEEVKQLAEAWNRDPIEETYMATAELLESELSDSDWRGFRRFLLERVGPRLVDVTFDGRTVTGWAK